MVVDELVRVAVEQQHRAVEAKRLARQLLHDRLEMVVLGWVPLDRRVPHVGLDPDRDRLGMPGAGPVEDPVQPFEVGRGPVLDLVHLRAGPRLFEPGQPVVVGAGHIDRAELDVGLRPGHVLGVPAPLGADATGVLAEGPARGGKEDPADLVEPGGAGVAVQHRAGRPEGAVVGPMAIGPLVVAGGVDERIGEAVEVGPDLFEVGGRALRGAVLDVAEVHRQADLRVGVDLRHVVGEVFELRRSVRRVADHGVGDGFAPGSAVVVGSTVAVGGGDRRQREHRRHEHGKGEKCALHSHPFVGYVRSRPS